MPFHSMTYCKYVSNTHTHVYSSMFSNNFSIAKYFSLDSSGSKKLKFFSCLQRNHSNQRLISQRFLCHCLEDFGSTHLTQPVKKSRVTSYMKNQVGKILPLGLSFHMFYFYNSTQKHAQACKV